MTLSVMADIATLVMFAIAIIKWLMASVNRK